MQTYKKEKGEEENEDNSGMYGKIKRKTKGTKKHVVNIKPSQNGMYNVGNSSSSNFHKYKLMTNLGSPKYQKANNLKMFHPKKSEKGSLKEEVKQKLLKNNILDQSLKKNNNIFSKNKILWKYPQSTKNVNRKTNFFKDNNFNLKKERKSEFQNYKKMESLNNNEYNNGNSSYNFKNNPFKYENKDKSKKYNIMYIL